MAFLEDVVLSYDGDECLIWPFPRAGNGYAYVSYGGKQVVASRLVCELKHGPPPTPEHEAAHSCNRGQDGCVTPGHLRWATGSENQMDRLDHGTHSRGERSPMHKLTEAEARTILSLKGRASATAVAQRYGVSRRTVGMIWSRQRWGWL